MQQQVKAKKSLGQHFLTDLAVAQRIAGTMSQHKALPLLEVGPGMGVLTKFLIAGGHDLKVVELDGESVAYLHKYFPMLDGRIIADDFLRLDLNAILTYYVGVISARLVRPVLFSVERAEFSETFIV